MRRKRNLINRTESCAHLLITEPDSLRGHWLEEYRFKDLHVELGCGKGRFTIETAKLDTGVLIVALEKVSNVLVVALERTKQDNLKNVRYINGFVEELGCFFAEGEISRIYINFCDPWPSNRHTKRRMTGKYLLVNYMQVLRPGGDIIFKTDNLSLFEYSLQEFKHCGFTLADVSRDIHKHGPVGVMTDYEMKFYKRGFPIYQCRVVKAV